MRRWLAVVARTSLQILYSAQALFDARDVRDVDTAVFVGDHLHPPANQIEKLTVSQ